MDHARTQSPLSGTPIDGVDESTWLDVIHKMDEVYTKLIDDEVELEKKNAELEQSQQFIFGVLAAMSDVLVVCDEQGVIEQVNAALCELVGRDESALRGQRLMALLADAASVRVATAAMARSELLRGGQSVEISLLDRDGQAVPVDATCSPRVGNSGKRIGTVWVGRPLAELKRAYHELSAAHEALKQTQQQLLHSEKMASLGQLVAGVAHELNNPISFVLGNVHALDRYSRRLRSYIEAMHAQGSSAGLDVERKALRIDHLLADLPSLIEGTLEGAQRTADIVHGLKRFSAVDVESHREVNLNEVIARAIHWVARAQPKPIEVRWLPERVFRVMGSDGQLQQVMMNLLQNAFDAVAGVPEPMCWIDAAVIEATSPAQSALPAAGGVGTSVRITVTDNGPGIAAEHLLRVFDPFFTTKPVGKGTGLGLSISYGIIEQHGGRMSAANAPAGGAAFTVELPLCAPG